MKSIVFHNHVRPVKCTSNTESNFLHYVDKLKLKPEVHLPTTAKNTKKNMFKILK